MSNLDLNTPLKGLSPHYVDVLNSDTKLIDDDFVYFMRYGFFAGTINRSTFQISLDAYNGIGFNDSGIFGVKPEDNTGIPKFLLAAKDNFMDFGWGNVLAGEFRVGDNVKEDNGWLVGKNWIRFSPDRGLQVQGPLLRSISSDTNIILSPSFDNITEFIYDGFNWDNQHGYGGGNCFVTDRPGKLSARGNKTIDGAVVIRGSVMYANSDAFPGTMTVEVRLYDINGNYLTSSISSLPNAPYGEWKRHAYVVRLDQSISADQFTIHLVVAGITSGSGHYVVFDNWNAYRVFQAATNSLDIPEKFPEGVDKGVTLDVNGIRAYWPDDTGTMRKTFEVSSADGNVFFHGNMLVHGYMHSGPIYEECDEEAGTPTRIVGCGANSIAIYGIAPNDESGVDYYIGRSKFILSNTKKEFTRPCDLWYWGDQILPGEFRVGEAVCYSKGRHTLYKPLDYNDPNHRQDSNAYLWYYPGDFNQPYESDRRYPSLTLKGNVLVNGYVHSGPVYKNIYEPGTGKWVEAIIGGVGINQYAIYGITTNRTADGNFKPGDSRFLISNTDLPFDVFDQYWGDGIFESEFRLGIGICWDKNNDTLVKADHSPSEAYMWFKPRRGAAEEPILEIKGKIYATSGSVIPVDGIDLDGPGGEEILNDKQKWSDVDLEEGTNLADFLKPSQGASLVPGSLVANDNFIGYFAKYTSGNEQDIRNWVFKVSNSGQMFVGDYNSKKYMWWDNSKLRIHGAVWADEGFIKDNLYVGDDDKGIQIYGASDCTTKHAQYYTRATECKPYIRSYDTNTAFNSQGWIILNDGTAHMNTIYGLGDNIHICTKYFWEEIEDSNDYVRNYRPRYGGLLSSYHTVDGSPASGVAIYLHKTGSPDDLSYNTVGLGIFEAGADHYKWLFYNMRDNIPRTTVEFMYVDGIYLQTGTNANPPTQDGIVLQRDGGNLAFFGKDPVPQPFIPIPSGWDGSSIDPQKLRDDLNIHQEILAALITKLGSGSGNDPNNMNLFRYGA